MIAKTLTTVLAVRKRKFAAKTVNHIKHVMNVMQMI